MNFSSQELFSHLNNINNNYYPLDKKHKQDKPKICLISNHYNESFHLKHFLDYYSKIIGSNNCIIVDHGSDEIFLDIIKSYNVGLINLPRFYLDEVQMSDFMSGLASSLLKFYDIIIKVDIDEIIVIDSRKYENLIDYFVQNTSNSYTAIGLNVVNEIYVENPYVENLSLFEQRKYVRFFSPMCKTIAITDPVHWSPGYHGLNLNINFNDFGLFLFHMREMDFTQRLKRIAFVRNFKRAQPHFNLLNQQISNQQLFYEFTEMASWPKSDNFIEIIEHAKFIQHNIAKEGNFNVVKMDFCPKILYRIPDYFKSPF